MTRSRPLQLTAVAGLVAATMFVGDRALEPASIPTAEPLPAPVATAPERPALAPDQLEAAVASWTMAITADAVTATTAGTGVVLPDDGLVVTNHHVIAGARTVTARSFGTGASFGAEVLGYDSTKDIAVLRLGGGESLPTAPLADGADVRIGDPITAIGNAEGDGLPIAARGAVTDLDQVLTARSSTDGSQNRLSGMMEVNAAVRPGDSGGPLVDDTGAVIGINTAGNAETDPGQPVDAPRSYAVPIAVATDVVDQVRSGVGTDTVRVGPTPVLGVTVTNNARGAEVLWVAFGSPAEQTGMKVGDVITAVDGRPLGSSRELTSLMMQRGPGDTVAFTWTDSGGAVQDGKVTLEEGPPR